MILEISASVLLNSEDMGFYIGPYEMIAGYEDGMDAHALIFKLWMVMIQFTIFTPAKKK